MVLRRQSFRHAISLLKERDLRVYGRSYKPLPPTERNEDGLSTDFPLVTCDSDFRP